MRERVARQLSVLAVFLVALMPTRELVAQPFSKKIAVESPRSSVSLGSATITIEKTELATVVRLSAPTEITANAFYIGNPARVVVDVSGCKTRRSENFRVSTHSLVSSVRVGAHADKLRIVLDLTRQTEPGFDVVVSRRDITVTIKDGVQEEARLEQAAPTAQPTMLPTTAAPMLPTTQPTTLPTVAAAPNIASEPTAVPSPGAPIAPTTESTPAAPTPAPSPLPALTTGTAIPTVMSAENTAAPVLPTPLESPKPTVGPAVPGVTPQVGAPVATKGVATAAPANAAAPQIRGPIAYLVTGYRFEYLEPGRVPILKILLNKPRANAQISKVGAKAYKIVIPSCGLGAKGLELPQFPPGDFLGFVMIASKVVDNKTEITVSVEQGVTLGTFVRQNEIWVKRL